MKTVPTLKVRIKALLLVVMMTVFVTGCTSTTRELPLINNIQKTASGVSIEAIVRPGTICRLEKTSDLSSGPWTNAGLAVTADTDTIRFFDPEIADTPAQYYRIITE